MKKANRRKNRKEKWTEEDSSSSRGTHKRNSPNVPAHSRSSPFHIRPLLPVLPLRFAFGLFRNLPRRQPRLSFTADRSPSTARARSFHSSRSIAVARTRETIHDIRRYIDAAVYARTSKLDTPCTSLLHLVRVRT